MRISDFRMSDVKITNDSYLYSNLIEVNETTKYVHTTFINIELNKVYYMVYNSSLIAFKVIMLNLLSHKKYLIQTPSTRMWVNLKECYLFSSKEHYFQYLEQKASPLEFELRSFDFTNVIHNDKHLFRKDTVEFQYTNCTCYQWSNYYNKPTHTDTKLNVAILCEQGIFINIVTNKKVFMTYEECVKSVLDGMLVEEFGDEEEVKITINISTANKPKIHTLRFIED
jgi:hypothetical protein